MLMPQIFSAIKGFVVVVVVVVHRWTKKDCWLLCFWWDFTAIPSLSSHLLFEESLILNENPVCLFGLKGIF